MKKHKEMKKNTSSYNIRLEPIELQTIRKTRKDDTAIKPLWSAPSDQDYYKFEVTVQETVEYSASDRGINSIDYPTVACHICNVKVPTKYIKDHKNSEKHKVCMNIAKIALQRVKDKMLTNTPSCEGSLAGHFCEQCSTIATNVHHDTSEIHKSSMRYDKLLKDLLDVYLDKRNINNIDLKYLTQFHHKDVENNNGIITIKNTGNTTKIYPTTFKNIDFDNNKKTKEYTEKTEDPVNKGGYVDSKKHKTNFNEALFFKSSQNKQDKLPRQESKTEYDAYFYNNKINGKINNEYTNKTENLLKKVTAHVEPKNDKTNFNEALFYEASQNIFKISLQNDLNEELFYKASQNKQDKLPRLESKIEYDAYFYNKCNDVVENRKINNEYTNTAENRYKKITTHVEPKTHKKDYNEALFYEASRNSFNIVLQNNLNEELFYKASQNKQDKLPRQESKTEYDAYFCNKCNDVVENRKINNEYTNTAENRYKKITTHVEPKTHNKNFNEALFYEASQNSFNIVLQNNLNEELFYKASQNKQDKLPSDTSKTACDECFYVCSDGFESNKINNKYANVTENRTKKVEPKKVKTNFSHALFYETSQNCFNNASQNNLNEELSYKYSQNKQDKLLSDTKNRGCDKYIYICNEDLENNEINNEYTSETGNPAKKVTAQNRQDDLTRHSSNTFFADLFCNMCRLFCSGSIVKDRHTGKINNSKYKYYFCDNKKCRKHEYVLYPEHVKTFCGVCDLYIDTYSLESHIASDKHAEIIAINAKMGKLAPNKPESKQRTVTADQTEKNTSVANEVVQDLFWAQMISKNAQLVICKVCNMVVPKNIKNVQLHVEGKTHQNNLNILLTSCHMKGTDESQRNTIATANEVVADLLYAQMEVSRYNKAVRCKVCDIIFVNSLNNVQNHIKGEDHQSKLNLLLLHNTVGSVGLDLIFEQSEAVAKHVHVKCLICNVSIKNIQEDIEDHVKGIKHQNNLDMRLLPINKKLHNGAQAISSRKSKSSKPVKVPSSFSNHTTGTNKCRLIPIEELIIKTNKKKKLRSLINFKKDCHSATSKDSHDSKDCRSINAKYCPSKAEPSKVNTRNKAKTMALKPQCQKRSTTNEPQKQNKKIPKSIKKKWHLIKNTADLKQYHCMVCKIDLPLSDDHVSNHLLGAGHEINYNLLLSSNRLEEQRGEKLYCEYCHFRIDRKSVLGHIQGIVHQKNLRPYPFRCPFKHIYREV